MRRGLALAAALATLVLAAPAAAAEGSLVGIRPLSPDRSWIETTLAPGAAVRAEAVVVNLSGRPQRMLVSAADGVTTADGVFTLAGEAETPRGVGAWITPDATSLDLAPGERRRLGITIRVPAGTPPGDHAGGVVVRPAGAGPATGEGAVAVRVVERVGLRVHVSVPGRRDGSVRLEGLAARPAGGGGIRGALGLPDAIEVGFTVRHAGNVRYHALHGLVEVLDGGRVTAAVPVAVGTLLPGGERRLEARVPVGGWSPRERRVRVTIGAIPPARSETTVGARPARFYGAGGLALGLVGLGGAGWWRRARRAR